MSATDSYKVWVGCLACYNDGRLVGEWFPGDEAPQDMAAFDEDVKVSACHVLEKHDELWVFDHEGSPAAGEYSPMDAAHYAELLESIADTDELAIVMAWLKYQGVEISESHIDEAKDAHYGSYGSDEDFARDLADAIGAVPEHAAWPMDCIDWERAAAEIMQDYFEEDGHYFRS